MDRATYVAGVLWIADNDDAAVFDVRTVAGFMTVAMLADLAGVSSQKVAKDVVAARKRGR
jgi:hypothetical protein